MAWLRKLAKKDPVAPPPARRILARRHTLINTASEPIDGRDFHNGAFLRKFSEHTVTESIRFLGKPKCCSRVIQVASVCIGSANDCLALDAFSTAMKREGVDMGFDICFNCEAHADKRLWINDVHSALHPEKPVPCNFDHEAHSHVLCSW